MDFESEARASSLGSNEPPQLADAPSRPPPDDIRRCFTGCMRQHHLLCTAEEIGMVVVYNGGGLQAHRPGATVQQSRGEIAEKILSTGMMVVEDESEEESHVFFRGSPEAFALAMNRLCDMDWVRPKANMEDVACLWQVVGDATQDAAFINFKPPFNA